MSGDASGAFSELMPRSLDCVDSVIWLPGEVALIVCCFVLGFLTLRVLQFPARRAKAMPLPAAVSTPAKPRRLAVSRPATAGFASLPHEITAEVSRCLPLSDFAATSVASRASQQRFGLCPEAWHLLATDRQLALPNSPERKTLESDALGRELREAFRRTVFGTDGRRLFQLGVGGAAAITGTTCHAAVLREVAHMIRGLMQSDGADIIELTCSAAERALQAHNPGNKDAAVAASAFLQVARRRQDLLSPLQAESLEGAYNSALQLQAFMDVAMDAQFPDMEILSERSQASTPASSSPRLPIVGPSVDEDEHELQRRCGLDALLEELRLQTESSSKE